MFTASDEAFSEEYQKIIFAINPENDTPSDLWKKLEMMSKEEIIESIKISSRETYLVLYTDYSDEQAHEVYSFTKGQAISFIADNFDEDREEGLDIVMCDDLYDIAYLGNHDGILLKKKTDNNKKYSITYGIIDEEKVISFCEFYKESTEAVSVDELMKIKSDGTSVEEMIMSISEDDIWIF